MEASALEAQSASSDNGDVPQKEYVQLQVTEDDATSDALIPIHHDIFPVPLNTIDFDACMS